MHVSVYVFMYRHVYVYEYDCFIISYMSICAYIAFIHAVRMPLLSNCALYTLDLLSRMLCVPSLPVWETLRAELPALTA